ncbi:MAG: hypothetical protein HY721_13360 [Planctomycetes bacterium]|nr:hypothetical protein [Planctomycetota bacterium]
MASRQPGLRAIPLSGVERVLRKERSGQRDTYAPLEALRLEVRDPLGLLPERFVVFVRTEQRELELRLTETSAEQICGLAGAPPQFLERVPAALGLRLLRCLLEVCPRADGRSLLLRHQGEDAPRLLAVLPHTFVRLEDLEVLAELRSAAGGQDLKVVSLKVTDDFFFVRIVLGDGELNLGTDRHPDRAIAGVDVITSQTGVRPLELRRCLFRVVCSNGLTVVSRAQRALRQARSGPDRERLQAALHAAFEEAVREGPQIASRLAETRAAEIRDPGAEIQRIFRRFQLGSPTGRIGRWIAQEVLAKYGLFVQKFELIQAFTAVARGLEHRDRMRLEDAMGAYLMEGAGGS